MSILELMVLAVIQGLTEFLPVSSKTHLMFAQKFMSGESDLLLTVVLHAGSLVAILVYYFKDWIELFKSRRREIGLLVLATIPAAVVGLLLKDHLETYYKNAYIAASLLLMLNGAFLFIADRYGRERQGIEEVPAWKVFVIGLAQSTALMPGISRSGSTIGTGMLLGLKRVDAVRFSFFMGAVAVAGALVLKSPKILELVKNEAKFDLLPIGIGILVAFAVSIAAIRLVEILSLKGRFAFFALYCAVAGLLGTLYFAGA